ncbi:MAG: hypothetical protein LBK67_10945 [Coriobacteriales bacterium]|jgi:hypothetical protein|nr:hypothetical protein [Coriobacteriales bacterium]
MMDYDDIITELEKGVDWSTWEDLPNRDVLQNKLIAMRQLEAIHRREADKLHLEQQQLSELLMAM